MILKFYSAEFNWSKNLSSIYFMLKFYSTRRFADELSPELHEIPPQDKRWKALGRTMFEDGRGEIFSKKSSKQRLFHSSSIIVFKMPWVVAAGEAATQFLSAKAI